MFVEQKKKRRVETLETNDSIDFQEDNHAVMSSVIIFKHSNFPAKNTNFSKKEKEIIVFLPSVVFSMGEDNGKYSSGER